jgi:hypothetical protein
MTSYGIYLNVKWFHCHNAVVYADLSTATSSTRGRDAKQSVKSSHTPVPALTRSMSDHSIDSSNNNNSKSGITNTSYDISLASLSASTTSLNTATAFSTVQAAIAPLTNTHHTSPTKARKGALKRYSNNKMNCYGKSSADTNMRSVLYNAIMQVLCDILLLVCYL